MMFNTRSRDNIVKIMLYYYSYIDKELLKMNIIINIKHS